MLFVTNGNQTEAILESNYEKYEEQNGAAMQISFSSFSFAENIGHSLLEPNALVEDEDSHEYIVKQFDKDRTSKSIVATHIYYELIGHRKYDGFTGTHNFNAFANWLFNGTGWTYVNVDVNETLTFNVFGNDNFLQLIQRLITKFNCEMQILPGKVIRFKKIIGEDNDLQYRYKHNIKELSQSIDTTNVRTRIIAYGADGLTVTYTSPLASNSKFGVIDAESVKDDKITTTSELTEFAKASLNDVPSTNIDASVIDTDGNVGDYVWVIHDETDLLYQTRILSKKTKRNYADSIVEIGNTKKRTIEDVLLDQKQEIKDNAEATEEAVNELEEKTDEKLAILEVSDTEIRASVRNAEDTLRSELSITAGQIRSEVTDIRNNLQSSITQTASQIRLEVSSQVTTINNNISTTNQNVASIQIQANQISSTVSSQSTEISNLFSRTWSAESSIVQQANQIALKVSQTDYNGSTITSLINQDPYAVSISANKINLNGAVIVNGSISGATDISVNRNAKIGNALYFGGSGLEYIDVSSGNMSFNSFGKFVFNGSVGVDVYGTLRVNGKRVLTEN